MTLRHKYIHYKTLMKNENHTKESEHMNFNLLSVGGGDPLPHPIHRQPAGDLSVPRVLGRVLFIVNCMSGTFICEAFSAVLVTG